MSIQDRHSRIIHMLKQAESPLSGSYLSKELGVSRQIIVSDMETLRTDGHMILSTPKGYVLIPTASVEKVFKVHHTVEQTEDELNLIIDLGAEVKDVFIYHRVYGEIHAKLNIASRRDIKAFCDGISSGKSSPLLTVTDGYHYHTVSAKDAETLKLVEDALWEKGYLAALTDFEPGALTKYFEANK